MQFHNQSFTKCPKCEKTQFELIQDTPLGTEYVHLFLRCAVCKTFLQMVPLSNTNVMIEQLQNDINTIKQYLKIVK